MSPRQSHQDAGDRSARSTTTIEDLWIELPDGVRLAARIWFPAETGTRPVSAILESVPYPISDGPAVRDAGWGSWFTDHGFAFVRIDLRGSGNSDGLLADEYTEQEQADVEHVIEWLPRGPRGPGAGRRV